MRVIKSATGKDSVLSFMPLHCKRHTVQKRGVRVRCDGLQCMYHGEADL